MGLHERYARIIGSHTPTLLAGRKEVEEEIRKRIGGAFEGMMKALYQEKGASLRIDILQEPEVANFIETHSDVLNSSMEHVEMSDIMRRRLERSNYIFSGFKTFHELNEAFPSLLDSDGNRKPFEQFYNDVLKIDSTYNKNYLQSEYNFIQSSAEMAAKWEQFSEDGDRYYLQYRTAGDDKVRPEHAALNRVTLPIDDKFWEEYFPPNGWNCRCTVVQVRKSKQPPTPHDEAMALGEEATGKDTKGMFHFNPGKEGQSVPQYNPYTIKDCKNCDFTEGNLAWKPNRQFCRACVQIKQCYQKHEQENGKTLRKYSKDEKHAIYETPLEEQFKTVYNGGENGMVQRHVLKDTNAMDYERVLSAGALYAKKEEVLLMPEIHSSERNIRELLGLPEKSNPDLKVGGRWIDVKSPFSTSTIIANANHAAKQGAIACITDDHCVIELSKINGYGKKILDDPNYHFNEVHFVVDGKLYKITTANE